MNQKVTTLKSYKDSVEFPKVLHPASRNANILRDWGTFTRTQKWTSVFNIGAWLVTRLQTLFGFPQFSHQCLSVPGSHIVFGPLSP